MARSHNMSAKQIVVLGGGFAGLWSAVGAARKLDELGHGPEAVEVTLVNRDAFHNIRVRNYETDLTPVRVPLDDVLGPVGVQRVEGQVTGIDLPNQQVQIQVAGRGDHKAWVRPSRAGPGQSTQSAEHPRSGK